MLAWTAESPTNGFHGNLRAVQLTGDEIGPTIMVADSVVRQSPLVVPSGNDLPPVWAAQLEYAAAGARQLRFWQRVDGRITEIAAFSDNFLVSITGTAWPGRVNLFGAERYLPLSGRPVSVMRSFRIECRT